MLPPNIIDLVNQLTEKTQNNSINWQYNDENATVSSNFKNFNIEVQYHFDMNEEVGMFILRYTDNQTGVMHPFSTTQLFNDYQTIKYLYDLARSSGLSFAFE